MGALAASDFEITASGGPVRVIELVPDQLLTESSVESPRMDGGLAVADPERDLAKIAVVERHHASGRIGRGFVRGFGLREGALASTVSHDAHNLIVVGASDDDMAVCVRRLVELGGGIVVVRDEVVLAELALPVAGLMSDRPSAAVAAALGELRGAARSLGVDGPGAVHGAQLSRPLGDPLAEDHRSRADRRRPLRGRLARGRFLNGSHG